MLRPVAALLVFTNVLIISNACPRKNHSTQFRYGRVGPLEYCLAHDVQAHRPRMFHLAQYAKKKQQITCAQSTRCISCLARFRVGYGPKPFCFVASLTIVCHHSHPQRVDVLCLMTCSVGVFSPSKQKARSCYELKHMPKIQD